MLLKLTTAPSETLTTSPSITSGKILGSPTYQAFTFFLETSIGIEISIGLEIFTSIFLELYSIVAFIYAELISVIFKYFIIILLC